MKQDRTVVPNLHISVAMATYNGERHIREQLESIACQTLLPCELVITDDGSTDTTLQIVEEFARTAPFSVRLIRNESRLGYSDNFIKAASLCRGDLIALCDQDDIWLKRKLRVCSECLADPRVLLAVHTAQTFPPSGGLGSCYPAFSRTGVLGFGACDPFADRPGFAMVIRKELLQVSGNRRRPARLRSHDHWFWFLAASAGQIATISEILTLYRQHANNIFGAPQRLTFAQLLRRTAGIIDYDGAADTELQCSSILADAAVRCPRFATHLKDSAARLEFRSKLHRLRTKIYRENSNFLLRAGIFRGILLTGGYLPDSSGTRLGPWHGIKDLLLGVAGIYRMLNSVAGL
jgi:glycosyltransferase involved in cell wall biosynthesis